MKKIAIIIAILSAGIYSSCSSDDKVVDNVLDTVTRGAVLRTVSLNSSNFNAFDPESIFSVTLEEQDVEDGGLMSSVDVLVSFTDNQDDPVDISVEEQLLLTLQPSDFTTGPNGLPRITFETSLSAAAAAVGLSPGEYSGGDTFTYRLVLNLTDGRSFTNTDASGTISGGSFFTSPYSYLVGVNCTPTSPIAGDYSVTIEDSYGDGWNGASITVEIDGVTTDYTLDDGASGSFDFTVPEGTSTFSMTFNSGDWDSEVTFQIFAPNGKIAADAGPSPEIGEIALSICPD
ncbi:hypothetical protein ACH3O9_10495 [Leeuwenhoekiella sp. A16]|uniref:hypothetical protein n=1 Tax=unclassified Leeuwenhoekiella TaxID=2615029 RepID=UPI003A80F6A6